MVFFVSPCYAQRKLGEVLSSANDLQTCLLNEFHVMLTMDNHRNEIHCVRRSLNRFQTLIYRFCALSVTASPDADVNRLPDFRIPSARCTNATRDQRPGIEDVLVSGQSIRSE
ncbi:hypothetical protein CLF_113345 [Clonorchis sinensis]|uniref:Uncharacterized protein n=1 Tax=Clonorchis sinensis TaxID=79923 RepID=G7YY86_CLOSI|nr:hypothetical protein CLF_113345 [Clonorchis sinensis]